jgi:ABC-type sugar transport system ATPase subunit
MVRGLIRQTNVSVIVIDHNYTHLFELCDRINVIQRGRVTIDRNISEMTLEELIEMMVQSYRRQIGSASGASASRGS